MRPATCRSSGPNCYGLINYLDGALLWPDQHGGARVERGVAIVTQSSNIAINMTMQRRGLPIAYVATAGNQAQTGLVGDRRRADRGSARHRGRPAHRGDRRCRRASSAWRSARASSRKPIVAMTVGRSEQVARRGHLAHGVDRRLRGGDRCVLHARRRAAAPLDPGIPGDAEAPACARRRCRARDLCSMSCSGGEAALIADAAVGRGVRFRPLEPSETSAGRRRRSTTSSRSPTRSTTTPSSGRTKRR